MPTKDKEKRRLQNKRYRERHPDTRNNRKRNETPERKQRWNLKTRYGMSIEDVHSLLEKQNGRCAICGKELKRYCIDHNHQTRKVRGILCHRCNIVIGGWDDPIFKKKALEYLGESNEYIPQ